MPSQLCPTRNHQHLLRHWWIAEDISIAPWRVRRQRVGHSALAEKSIANETYEYLLTALKSQKTFAYIRTHAMSDVLRSETPSYPKLSTKRLNNPKPWIPNSPELSTTVNPQGLSTLAQTRTLKVSRITAFFRSWAIILLTSEGLGRSLIL